VRRTLAVVSALGSLGGTLHAQAWDGPAARAIVERAVARRAAAFADSGLRDWTANARGFVFFLGQIGEGLAEPPRLVKADQLALQVYWRAPNQSRQRIVGWRDRADLPTDISYHRDHLGIVMNNFPDLIRLGEGDEVRDVPHPVSAAGMALYEYALTDSLVITLPQRELRVYEVRFRPRDFRAPRILGAAYVEVASADLVRMTFNFTRAAYLDDQLEDIAISVENSLWGGRWWLPLRQEIEIRRRATWMDFPARGIIRGRWEIGDYRFNTGIDPGVFRFGAEITAAPRAVLDTFPWTDDLDAAIRDIARPATMEDFDAVRTQALEMAAGHVLTGLRQRSLAGGAVSDFVRVDRVQGLAFGAGVSLRSADEARELRLRAGAATARWLPTGSAEGSWRRGPWTFRLGASRAVRDLGDVPVISGVVNTLSAQELGADYGDWYLASAAGAGVERGLGARSSVALTAGWVRVDSLTAVGEPARGAWDRPNPGVDEGDWATARLTLRRRSGSFATTAEASGRLELEAGVGPLDYWRGFAEGRGQLPAGRTTVVLRAAAGALGGEAPRHRAFVLGGRGTLLGSAFRGAGGRRMAWTSVEWQVPVGVPEVRLGSFAGTGRSITVAPGVAVGWAGGAVPGFPAVPLQGPEATIGLGVELFHRLLRVDVGYALRAGAFGAAVDVSRDFWDIL
jgi:hypothetical protein